MAYHTARNCRWVPVTNYRAGRAPSVERRSHNPKVPSSILGLRMRDPFEPGGCFSAHAALSTDQCALWVHFLLLCFLQDEAKEAASRDTRLRLRVRKRKRSPSVSLTKRIITVQFSSYHAASCFHSWPTLLVSGVIHCYRGYSNRLKMPPRQLTTPAICRKGEKRTMLTRKRLQRTMKSISARLAKTRKSSQRGVAAILLEIVPTPITMTPAAPFSNQNDNSAEVAASSRCLWSPANSIASHVFFRKLAA